MSAVDLKTRVKNVAFPDSIPCFYREDSTKWMVVTCWGGGSLTPIPEGRWCSDISG